MQEAHALLDWSWPLQIQAVGLVALLLLIHSFMTLVV